MRTTQLEYFKSVARTLSFTRASEECHVAQPAISQQIKALEDELGFPLFVRSTKGVQLTAAGRAYYHDTLGVIDALDKSAKRARAIAEGSAGVLTVGVANSGQTAYFDALRGFMASYPEVELRLARSRSLTQLQELHDGAYDIMVTAVNEDAKAVSYAAVEVNELCIVASADHPLANAKGLVPSDLLSFPHIIADCENQALVYQTYPYLEGSPETPLVRAEDQDIALADMIMGLGVEAMPVHVAQDLGADSCILDVVGYHASLAVGWAYLASNDNPALVKFLEFLN